MIGSNGGKATAIKSRQQAVERYYEKPNFCKECGEIIELKKDEKIGAVRKKSFCDRECFGKFKSHSVEISSGRHSRESSGKCIQCSTSVDYIKRKSGTMYLTRKYCEDCKPNNKGNSSMLDIKKGDLFSNKKNWQSARSCIQRIARKVFKASHVDLKCSICGYSTHVEVAHIKSVSEFPKDATIGEINDIKNLIGLCPNHHWEYDNGVLKMVPGTGVEPV